MQIFTQIRQYVAILIITTILFTVAGFAVSKAQIPQYKSTVQLLIIQKYSENFDAYTAQRSAETLAESLSKIIYTSSFREQALKAPFQINDNFSQDPKERKDEWKKSIGARIVNPGNIEISVYQQDAKQAEQLAYGIAYIMVTKGADYHGGAQQVEIKMIEKPLTSQTPVKPNTLLNTILGFVLGILTSLGIIFLLPEKKAEQKISSGRPENKHQKKIDNQPKIQEKFNKYMDKRKEVGKFTGEEYSQEKVDEWVRSGKFENR